MEHIAINVENQNGCHIQIKIVDFSIFDPKYSHTVHKMKVNITSRIHIQHKNTIKQYLILNMVT